VVAKSWRAHRHARNSKPAHPDGTLGEQALDVGEGHMSFEHISVDDDGVAQAEIAGDAQPGLVGRPLRVIDRLNRASELLTKLSGPFRATGATGSRCMTTWVAATATAATPRARAAAKALSFIIVTALKVQPAASPHQQ
jgi:hypothetical protein